MACDTSTTSRRVRPPRPAAERGFTLIEATIASVVLAICVVGISASLTATTRQSKSLEEDATALLLARQMIEEVSAKPFLDPDTGTVNSREATRSLYDNVYDYNGYSETVDAAHPVASLQGKTVAVTNGRAYTRAVAVDLRSAPGGPSSSTGNFAMVTVTVTPPSGRAVSVSRLTVNATFQQQ